MAHRSPITHNETGVPAFFFHKVFDPLSWLEDGKPHVGIDVKAYPLIFMTTNAKKPASQSQVVTNGSVTQSLFAARLWKAS